MTMLCFHCKFEYPRGVTHCSDCGAMLVYRFPTNRSSPKLDPDTHLIVLRTFHSKLEADCATMTLAAAGIKSLIWSDDYGSGALPQLSFINGIQILVRSEDLEDADQILRADASGTV
jgi:hypothetical protein